MKRGTVAVLLLATIWRAALLLEIRDTPLAVLYEWKQSDMSSFLIQARRFADGDWLARAPYFPWHTWMQRIPQAEWARWHPPMMYYQPPLYSYALAGLMRLGIDPGTRVPWLQAALGVVSCALMIALASRLFGRSAGLAAGLLQAVYGPLIMSESQILRDGPILFETLLLLLLAVDSIGRERRGSLAAGERRWRAWMLGLLAGLMATLHEGALFLGFYAMLWGAWNAWRRSGRGAALQWSGILALGAIVGLSPMLARNAALGMPLAPRFFGSVVAMATANHPDIGDLKMLPDNPARFAADMRAAQGNPVKLMASIMRNPASDPLRLPARWCWRLLALTLGPEANENLNYAYFRDRAAILNLALDFRWLAPLAGAGAIALGGRRWRARLAGGLGLTACFGLTMIGMISAVQPFGRYRLILLPLLAPLAGFAIVKLGCAIAGLRGKAPFHCRWIRLARLSALAAVLVLLQLSLFWVPSLKTLTGLRPTEYLNASRILLRWGHPGAAAAELRQGLAHFPYDSELIVESMMAEAIGAQEKQDYAAALRNWRAVLKISPGQPLATLGESTASQGRPLAIPADAIP